MKIPALISKGSSYKRNFETSRDATGYDLRTHSETNGSGNCSSRFQKIGHLTRAGKKRRYESKKHFVLAKRLALRNAVRIPFVEDAAGGSQVLPQGSRQNRENLIGFRRPHHTNTGTPGETSRKLVGCKVCGTR